MKHRHIINKRILVANRGEIAIRLFRAATELNMRTVAIYSHEDRFSVHRFKADEAYKVGNPGEPLDAYLNWKNIIKLALEKKIDVIHPGYGFLSENKDFAKACEDNNILFCGPSSKTIDLFGDKLKAKEVAIAAGVPVIPGTEAPVETLKDAITIAKDIGYPVTLKALSGGGGKGIRAVFTEDELKDAFERSQSEAKASFGRSDIYIEKNIQKPKHIEVQIAGDIDGNVYHLFERNCSIQRRHQKVVEVAPANELSQTTKDKLYKYSVDIGKHVSYTSVGTVEFLVDQEENIFFLEVNPRIQVEHTVTEMITGIDIAQLTILLSAGKPFTHPAIRIKSQQDLKQNGVAIQCRITSENPSKDFAPDTGAILAYRPAQGFGIRLDEGFATSGGLVTPHYDSLLVKVTAHGNDLHAACQKMIRALKEFRIRGVKQNIPLLINIIGHPKFQAGDVNTSFLTEHKEVFNFKQPRDRATKLLKYIADTTVNNPHNLVDFANNKQFDDYKLAQRPIIKTQNAKAIFDSKGAEGLNHWILNSKELLLTDTSMRDAHQSLFATRLRNFDINRATEFYSNSLNNLFSLEVWGGATFDTSLRFLKEDPWERLANIREAIPNVLLQMLLRGDNAVGYTNYPKWVIQDFIRLTAQSGLDIFRIFDCLNNPRKMSTAIEEVKKQGKIAEACVCYTGNILDKTNTKYTTKYFINVAKDLESMGADIICIKDMAGLLRPKAAEILINELKENVKLPIHLHTHATSGSSEAMLLAASDAGCDIVDGASSSMSGLTSQPSLNAIISSLESTDRESSVSIKNLDEIARYWGSVRSKYKAFDPGLKSTSTDVYEHEIPGGQYSNLYNQAEKVGVSANDFYDLTQRYKDVNELLGNIVKVTPSSKVVGDFALLLQKNKMTGEEFLKTKPQLDYPDSVISFFKGHMGVPYQGFNEEVRKIVLGSNPEPEEMENLDDSSFETTKNELKQKIERDPSDYEVISYKLYPKVWMDYFKHKSKYGRVDQLPTDVFFYGLEENKELEVDLEPGKTLIISLTGMTKADESGMRKLFFQLNGFPRVIEIKDKLALSDAIEREKADLTDIMQIGAPMPGKVVELKKAAGDRVEVGETILVTESMKMEYAISAKKSGIVSEVTVKTGDLIDEGDLLVKLS